MDNDCRVVYTTNRHGRITKSFMREDIYKTMTRLFHRRGEVTGAIAYDRNCNVIGRIWKDGKKWNWYADELLKEEVDNVNES
jgi:hypothetical protein